MRTHVLQYVNKSTYVLPNVRVSARFLRQHASRLYTTWYCKYENAFKLVR